MGLHALDIPVGNTLTVWSDVQERVKNVHPRLWDALESHFDSSTELQLISANYGQYLIYRGKLTVERLTQSWAGVMPLALVLSGSVEVSLQQPSDGFRARIAPLRLISPGEMFGVFETLDRMNDIFVESPWFLTAGSISAILVGMKQKQMVGAVTRAYGVSEEISELNVADKENFLATKLIQVVNHGMGQGSPRWFTEVLVLPDSVARDSDVLALLYELAWEQSTGLRMQVIEDVLRQNDGVRTPCSEKMIRHHWRVATGQQFAYRPAQHGEKGGPFLEVLERILADDDRIRRALKSAAFPYVLVPTLLAPQQGGDTGFLSYMYANIFGDCREARLNKTVFANDVFVGFRTWALRLKSVVDVSASMGYSETPDGLMRNVKDYLSDIDGFGADCHEQISVAQEAGWVDTMPLGRSFFSVFLRLKVSVLREM